MFLSSSLKVSWPVLRPGTANEIRQLPAGIRHGARLPNGTTVSEFTKWRFFMSRTGFIVLRLVGVLLLVGLLIGAGVIAYRSGYSQGVVEGAAMAAAGSGGESGQVAPLVPGYGYYPGYALRPFGGFFFTELLGVLFFGFLFLTALRRVFRPRFGWGRGWYGRHAYAGHPWGGPPWAWRGEQPPEKPEPSESADRPAS
jgi:hypothetical protein